MNTTNEPVTGAPQGDTAPVAGGRKAPSKLVWAVVVIVVVLLVALIVFKGGMFKGAPTEDGVATSDPSSVVATVNGTNITRSDLEAKANQVRLTIPPEAIGANFEQLVLDEMVNLQLLIARANERGFAATATDERIDAEVAKIVEVMGGQESFDVQIAELGLSLEQLRANTKNDLMIRALVDAETNIEDISVTDEELKAAYDLAFPPGGENTQTLEQVGEMLRVQLLRQKSDAIIRAYIEEIRSKAAIQSFL